MDRLYPLLPAIAKRCAWNLRYGLLGYPQFTAPEDAVQCLSTRLSASASMLELGCGRGSLLRGLRRSGWVGSYCGVDVSRRAIDDARKLADQRSAWFVSDFESFRSPFTWDIVAMIESIYYVRLDVLPVLLSGVMRMLSESGFLMIRVHDFKKHQKYIETVRRLYSDAETVSPNLLSIARSQRQLSVDKSVR